MLAELSRTKATFGARKDSDGSLSAENKSASSSNCRKKIGGRWSLRHRLALGLGANSRSKNRLEKGRRRGRRRIR